MFEQQQFRYYMRPSNALRRYNGCRLIALTGALLVLVGLLVSQLAGGVTIRLKYTAEDSHIYFHLNGDHLGPWAVYAHLDNFYANVRQYIDDAPPYFTHKRHCRLVNRVGELHLVRDPASMPEVNRTDPNALFWPCGLQSAAYYNDYFKLFSLPCDTCADLPNNSATGSVEVLQEVRRCCQDHRVPIEVTEDIAFDPSSFPIFAIPQVPQAWAHILQQFRLQNWYFAPFLNDRMVFIGMLGTYRLAAGFYELELTQNVWPAKEWNTGKEIVLTAFGALGSEQRFLYTLCLAWGAALLLIAFIFYWAIRKDIVYLTDTMASIPSKEIQAQWIQHAQGWTPAFSGAAS